MSTITGQQFHELLHNDTQQDVELDKLYMDAAKCNNRVMGRAPPENQRDGEAAR